MPELREQANNWTKTLPDSARLVSAAGEETQESLQKEYRRGAGSERQIAFSEWLIQLAVLEHEAMISDRNIRI